jgi:uncharacterized RDD family membrane protein YckC
MHLLEVFPAEWLLLAVICVLFLTDSVVLLDPREALLYPTRGEWAVAFGSRGFTLLGRPTYLLNLWTLHRPVFRLTLRETHLSQRSGLESNGSPSQAKDWEELRHAFGALLLVPWAVAMGLFVFLPLGLFTAYGRSALWAALVLVYGTTVVGVFLVWQGRHTFALEAADWAGLAFDILACPPHALNLVRKLSLHVSRTRLPDTDLLPVAAMLLSGNAEQTFFRQLAVMVDDLMDIENNEAELGLLGELRKALAQEISRGSC